MRSSERDVELDKTPKQRYDAAAAKILQRVAERRTLCEKYVRRARNMAWDVDLMTVVDNFPWFDAWANRLIPFGHVVSRAGLKRMSRRDYLEWSITMNIPKVVMLDTVGTAAANIPRATPFIGGYVSGSGVVPWSGADWSPFPNSRKFRIEQDPNANPDPHSYDIIDMEYRALTADETAQDHKRRVDAGVEWTTVYATQSNLALVTAAIKGLGGNYFDGHVNYWLADWNLDEEQAAALIGTFVEGATCVAVQWASPTSNPNTPVPGGSSLLVHANVDISVADGNWMPSGTFSGVIVPKPVPVTEHGDLITEDSQGNLAEKNVSSTDGTHWQ
jgi:hypothetical protein